MKTVQNNKDNNSVADEIKESIYSNFEILMTDINDENDYLRKTKPFYRYYEPILNSMLGELCDKGRGSNNECFVNYNIFSFWIFRKLEYSFVLEHVFKSIGRRDKILDLGGGIAPFINVFSSDERKCVSIDSSPYNVLFMHKNNKRIYGKECAFHNVNMADLIYESNQFDFVISVSVFEHMDSIKNIKKAVEEAFRVLKPTGKLVCTWGFQNNSQGMDLSPANFKSVISEVLMPFSQEIGLDISLPSEEEIINVWKKFWFPSCKYGLYNMPRWAALGLCLTKKTSNDILQSEAIRFRKNINGKFFDNNLLYLSRDALGIGIKMKYYLVNNTVLRNIARKIRNIVGFLWK